jgi:superfamily II DNA or RNA helicase
MQPESCAIISRAGTGKTNMIMIAARQLLYQNVPFAIIVANQYLYHQMYSDAKLFFPDEDIQVATIESVDAAFARNKVLILDEADAMIDQHKIEIDVSMKQFEDIGGLVGVS